MHRQDSFIYIPFFPDPAESRTCQQHSIDCMCLNVKSIVKVTACHIKYEDATKDSIPRFRSVACESDATDEMNFSIGIPSYAPTPGTCMQTERGRGRRTTNKRDERFAIHEHGYH